MDESRDIGGTGDCETGNSQNLKLFSGHHSHSSVDDGRYRSKVPNEEQELEVRIIIEMSDKVATALQYVA